MTSHVVASEWDRKVLLDALSKRPLPFTVDVTKGKRRSVEQNRLQRLLLNEIAEQLGDRTPEEVRGECKLELGVPILRAENEGFRERYDAVVRPFAYETKLQLMMEPFDFAVTRLMNTSQKTRYLDAIYRKYSQLGCVLTMPAEAA